MRDLTVNHRVRVLIVDDHDEIRSSLRHIIEKKYEVVGEALNGREAIEATELLEVDVVVMDVSMPVMGGFEAARLLLKRWPELRLIFVSQHADPNYVEQAFHLGAHGYILKRLAGSELLLAIG